MRIPDDRAVIASHRAIRKETTAAGNIRFMAESTDDGHADDFWAHALALHAGKSLEAPFAYESIPTASRHDSHHSDRRRAPVL